MYKYSLDYGIPYSSMGGGLPTAVSPPIMFDPSTIPNLEAWFKADDESSINTGTPINGENVNTWLDQTANNNDATQVTASKQPKWQSSGFSVKNKPYLDFFAINVLEANTLGSVINGVDQPLTVVFIGEVENLSITNGFFSVSRVANPFEFFSVRVNSIPEFSIAKRGDTAGDIKSVSGGTPLINTPYIMAFRTDGLLGDIDVNSSSIVSGGDMDTTSSFLSDAGRIGARRDNTGSDVDRMDGKMAELLIFKRSLSNSELTDLENYANMKYGI